MKKLLFLLTLFVSALLYPDIARAADAETITDELTAKNFGYTKGSSDYLDKSYTTAKSGAEYAGNLCCTNVSGTLYLTFKEKTTGVWVTKSPEGYKISKIEYTYKQGQKCMQIFAGTDVYSAPPSSGSGIVTSLKATGYKEFDESDYYTSFCFTPDYANTTESNQNKTSAWETIKVTWVKAEAETDDSTVATPKISGPTSAFYVPQDVSISCNTEEASIYYNLNSDEDPTDASTPYTKPFTISGTTTVKAIALKEGLNPSVVSTATFTAAEATEVASIADLIANPTADTIYKITNPVTVVYKNGTYLYVSDPDMGAGMLLYYSSTWDNYDYAEGQTLTNVIGKYTLQNNLPELIPDADMLAAYQLSGEASTVTPAIITAEETKEAANYNRYVKLTGETITSSSSKYYIANGAVQLYERFGLNLVSNIDTSVTYTIVGFPAVYSTTKEFFPIALIAAPATPVVTYGDSYQYTANAGEEHLLAKNTPYKVTSKGATRIEYQLNGGGYTTLSESDSYEGTFTEYGTYSFKGINSEGVESEFSATFNLNTTKPQQPVVTIGDETYTDGSSVAVLPGTEITISAEGATDIYDGDDNKFGSSPYTFAFEDKTATVTYKGYNSVSKIYSDATTTITYTVKAPEALTATYSGAAVNDGDKVNMVSGASVVLTSAGAVTYTASSADSELTATTDAPNTFVIPTPGEYTFTASNSAGSQSIKLTFKESVYVLVSSTDDLVEGWKYIIYCSSSDVALKGEMRSSGNNFEKVSNVKATNNTITNPSSDVLILEAEQADGGWYWKTVNYNGSKQGYLSNTSDNNYLQLKDDACLTTVSFDSSKNVEIKFGGSAKDRIIKYNTTGFFASYSSTSSQTAVQLYKLEDTDTPKTPIVTYGDEDTAADLNGTNTLPYGTTIKVYSQYATQMKVETSPDSDAQTIDIQDGTYTFKLTKDATYSFTGLNGEFSSKEVKVDFAVARPAAPVITVDDKEVGSTYEFQKDSTVTVTATSTEGTKVQYKLGDDEYADMPEDGLEINADNAGTYTFIALDTTSGYSSEAVVIEFKATESYPAPQLKINGELVEELVDIEVYADTPITIVSNDDNATSVKITVDGNEPVSADLTEGAYTFYAAEKASYSIVTVNNDKESEALVFNVKVVKHAAPIASINGKALGEAATVKMYESAVKPITITAEGATKIAIQFEDDNEATIYDGESYTFTPKEGMYSFYAIYGTEEANNVNDSKDTMIEVIFSKKPLSYALVTDVNDLNEDGSYIIVANSTTPMAMSNEKISDYRGATEVTFVESKVYAPAEDVMTFSLKKTDDGYQWFADNYDSKSTTGLTFAAATAKSGKTNITMTETPSATTVTITAKGVATISGVNTITDRQILFSSDKFANYATSNASSSGYNTISIYKLVMDETPEISDFTSVAADQEYYMIGNATVRFRHGKDLWIYDDNGNTIHAVMKAGSFKETVESGYVISNFKLTNISEVVSKVFNADIVYVPQTVTDLNKEVEILKLEAGTALTDANVGQAVIVKGKLDEGLMDEDEGIILLSSGDDPNFYYTLVRYLGILESATSANKAPTLISEDSSWTWAAYTDAWLTAVPDEVGDSQIYVGGMVDKNGDEYVIYPVSMSLDEDQVVSVKPITIDEQTTMIGRDLYLPEGAALYTINGTRIATDNLANGIYIIRYATGKATKILVK